MNRVFRAVRAGNIVFSGKPGAYPRGYLKPSTHPEGLEEVENKPVDKQNLEKYLILCQKSGIIKNINRYFIAGSHRSVR